MGFKSLRNRINRYIYPQFIEKKLRFLAARRLDQGPQANKQEGWDPVLLFSRSSVLFSLMHDASLITLLLDLDEWTTGNQLKSFRRLCNAFQCKAKGPDFLQALS